MKTAGIPTVYVIAGAAVGVALLYVAVKGARGTGKAIGSGAVDLADGVIEGSVKGIGAALGIPDTNKSECQKAIEQGRTWDASFACSASDFLKYLWRTP